MPVVQLSYGNCQELHTKSVCHGCLYHHHISGSQGEDGREGCTMALICYTTFFCSGSTQNWQLYRFKWSLNALNWPEHTLLLHKPALWGFCHCCFCSVAQLCPTLCDPMDCSLPGFPVLHYLLEFAQVHVHWVSDAIQPSHPLLPPSFAFHFPQHHSLFQWFISSHQVAKVLELQLQHQFFGRNWYSGLISISIDWFDFLKAQALEQLEMMSLVISMMQKTAEMHL